MIKYTISIENAHRQYIQFRAEFEHDGSEYFALQLPAWRPGRYELGNFAKNVRNFRALDASEKPLAFSKKTKDCWKIEGKFQSKIIVKYEFYAAELNAGSTFLDEHLLYVNPVNCFMYRPGREEVDSFEVELCVPENFVLASPLADKTKKTFIARNVHELMDSPFMTSSSLQHHQFEVQKCHFHIWINGTHQLDLKKIEADFTPFCHAQIRDFDGIPVDDYLFLFHFLAEKGYHGVEHEKCTVITLGPAEKLLTQAFYEELLGVSSHELYHTWNVKALRPKDMLPYNYTKENYSSLGYIYEGVTTYMGDWYLLSSGVFDFSTYAKHLGSYLNRHFQNYGRHNYSVAESSFDTWLDGYIAGAPGRKTSIYTEGCLVAFLCDLKILEATNGTQNLATAMHLLWKKYGLTGIGYTAENYFETLEEIAKISFQDIRERLLEGTNNFRPYFDQILSKFGLQLKFEENKSRLVSHTGIKAGALSTGELKIIDIEPHSPADVSGIHIGDKIVSINGIHENLNDAIKEHNFDLDCELGISHIGNISLVRINSKKGDYFQNVSLLKVADHSESQNKMFSSWSNFDKWAM